MTQQMNKRVRVIIVTDGDPAAQRDIEMAAEDLGLFVLRVSGGNPSQLGGREIVSYVLQVPRDPVVVMADDQGFRGTGAGERIIENLLDHPERIEVLGVIAVASNSRVKGVGVDCSVTAGGKTVNVPVDKYGHPAGRQKELRGDTVEILARHPDLLVIGCGDLGKNDETAPHAAATRRGLEEILKRRGIHYPYNPQDEI
ncbi:MAG TPA: stage V sporulation protein AE [Syntrophomonadaceae bacterium]|nr:stage V sporulation protein AE [Syntrophomonadaceae bacterium]